MTIDNRKTKHTSGPWGFDPESLNCPEHEDSNRGSIHSVKEGWIIAEMCADGDSVKANANLIASSPEMHARLERLLEYLLSIRALKAITGPTIDKEILETRRVLYVSQGLTGHVMPATLTEEDEMESARR